MQCIVDCSEQTVKSYISTPRNLGFMAGNTQRTEILMQMGNCLSLI